MWIIAFQIKALFGALKSPSLSFTILPHPLWPISRWTYFSSFVSLCWFHALLSLIITVCLMARVLSFFHRWYSGWSFFFSFLVPCSTWNQIVHLLCACQFPHPQSITAVWCVRVCVFISSTDQRGAQIDIHFACTFSFYMLSRSERWEEPEDMKEQESAGEIKEKH